MRSLWDPHVESLRDTLHRLTQIDDPTDRVEPGQLRQTQLLSLMLLVLILLPLPLLLLPNLFRAAISPLRNPTFYTTLGVTIVSLMAYALNRRGQYMRATILAIAGLTIGLFTETALGLLGISPIYAPDDVNLLAFLVVPVLLSSMLLSIPLTALITVTELVGMFLLVLIFPQITLSMLIWGPFSFVLIVSALVLLAAHHRNRLEAIRQTRLMENEKRFRRAVFAAPFPIMLHAEDGEIIAVNQAWSDITGYTHADIPTVEAWTARAYGERGERPSGLLNNPEVSITNRDGERRIWHFRSAALGTRPDGRRLNISMAMDVTERKYADEQLAFQSLLLDQIQDLVTATDLEGTITYVNEAECRALGKSAAELLGQSIARYGENVAGELSLQEILEVTRAAGEWRGELTNVDAEGKLMVLDSRTHLIHNEQGEMVGILSVNTDITERKRAEQALRRERDLLYTLMDNIPDTIYFKDVDGRFTLINAAQARLLGLDDPTQAIGTTDFDYFTPEHAQDAFADEQRIVASGRPVIGKLEKVRRADGAFRWVSVTKVPICNREGKITGIVGISRDVTERKQAEDALRESKALFQSLVESMPQNVFSKDLEGRFTFANQKYCRLQGLSREEILGKKDADLHPPEWVKKYRADDRAVIEKEETFETVEVHQPLEGQKSYVRVIKTPIYDAEGNVGGLLGMFWDITERREMERQLQQQERLAAVGQLAAGIAHDFRNLLSTIILYAQIPMRNPALPPAVMRNLQTIVDESYKATDLVQQILDFSSRAMIKPRPLDLSALTDDTCDVLDRTLPENISLALVVAEAEAGTYVVEADPGRIQQALTNLALNARDAMPGGGELRISLSPIAGKADVPPPVDVAPGDWIRLAVADTGTGMTEEVQEHLFEPFFTTKDVGKGSGLGLAQVYGIVRQHAGHIDVTSQAGEGTIVHIYLPIHRGERAEKDKSKEAAALPPTGRNETILFVEDQARLREAGREMLESCGYHVVTAANGQEALAKCQAPRWSAQHEGPVALVVTDLVMPEMGGKELLRVLRDRRPKLPILAITGYALQGEELKELRDMGFDGVLSKPLDIDTWVREIRRILDGE